jgi:hypothetical protein
VGERPSPIAQPSFHVWISAALSNHVGQHGDAEEEDEFQARVEHGGDKAMSKHAIMFRPETADEREGRNDRSSPRGVENILHPRGHIEPSGEE